MVSEVPESVPEVSAEYLARFTKVFMIMIFKKV